MEPIKDKVQPQGPGPKDFFQKNNYVLLSEVISEEEAARLTKYMFDLKESGATENDPQCPLSDAIYGAPEFDNLLQKLTEPLSHHLGVKLLPCYTYARIYRPGEVLKMHKDRPSCEVSGTMTLGFDGKSIWPIYFDEEKRHKVDIGIGELAMYKGCEVAHWRPEFKGTWQVQVFLHYVNADGPYAHHYADGRKEFGKPKSPDNMREDFVDAEKSGLHEKVQSGTEKKGGKYKLPILMAPVMLQSMDESFPGYYPIFSDHMPQLMFTPEECQKIIDISKDDYADDAGVGGGAGRGVVAKEIRDAEVYGVHPNKQNMWIFEKLGNIISFVNTHHFDYDLAGITHGLQLLHYRHKPEEETNGHYNWHIDSGPGQSALRKVSMSVQLSDDKYYEGGDLEVYDHAGPVMGVRQKGSVHMFPSYMPHKVHPVTKGERWALVIWVHGFRRFR